MPPALFFLLGLLLAAAHTASLAWNANLYLSPSAAGRAVLLHLARMGVVVAVLIAFALAGRAPLLAALAGFACAHAALVPAMRRRFT